MFTEVDWSERGEYMHDKHGVTIAQANDALRDPNRVHIHPDYNSESGKSDRIIGYSHSADALLTIIVLDHEGHEYGVNGWKSNTKDQNIYRKEQDQ